MPKYKLSHIKHILIFLISILSSSIFKASAQESFDLIQGKWLGVIILEKPYHVEIDFKKTKGSNYEGIAKCTLHDTVEAINKPIEIKLKGIFSDNILHVSAIYKSYKKCILSDNMVLSFEHFIPVLDGDWTSPCYRESREFKMWRKMSHDEAGQLREMLRDMVSDAILSGVDSNNFLKSNEQGRITFSIDNAYPLTRSNPTFILKPNDNKLVVANQSLIIESNLTNNHRIEFDVHAGNIEADNFIESIGLYSIISSDTLLIKMDIVHLLR